MRVTTSAANDNILEDVHVFRGSPDEIIAAMLTWCAENCKALLNGFIHIRPNDVTFDNRSESDRSDLEKPDTLYCELLPEDLTAAEMARLAHRHRTELLRLLTSGKRILDSENGFIRAIEAV